jgi:hypothetical protein
MEEVIEGILRNPVEKAPKGPDASAFPRLIGAIDNVQPLILREYEPAVCEVSVSSQVQG